MDLEETPIAGLFVLHRSVHRDERGFFSRVFGVDELAKAGCPTQVVHVNTSTSIDTGTLRGIHYQYPPHAEKKIVSCASGAIWDIGVDLRPGSPTRFQWFGKKLTPENGLSMIIPEGFGHAFITLEPKSTVIYIASAAYSPSHESGINFDDPLLGIDWPTNPSIVSEKDRGWGFIKNRMHELDMGFACLL